MMPVIKNLKMEDNKQQTAKRARPHTPPRGQVRRGVRNSVKMESIQNPADVSYAPNPSS
jgi:hypothetical protein